MQNIPIPTVHLFAGLERKLIELLSSLSAEEWNKQTVARLWTVKDVAAHLLDGNIRGLSVMRDHYSGDTPGNIDTNDNLISYLNQINADWVHAMKRASPQVLLALLEATGTAYYKQLNLLDPFAKANFAVSWAGEDNSLNWFNTARDYTERWHHQQQVRDAVSKPGIMSKELYYPVLDTFMMAMPHTYRNTHAADNTVVQVSITGDAGGDWFLVKKENWELCKANILPVTAQTTIEGDIAWKLFTKSWRRNDVQKYVSIDGDTKLGEVVLEMISVMA
ncbi:MAG: maleylpyruvate isomerase N-terminal domain-containing protein [Bacteroidota bacterium]